MKAKVCISGVHGIGKSRICEKILLKILNTHFSTTFRKINRKILKELSLTKRLCFIPEQIRDVSKDIGKIFLHNQTEEITLATYAKQLYLENLYAIQGKNILCDRSVLDAFVYHNYFNQYTWCLNEKMFIPPLLIKSYSKIYLIEPSDREIENDGFRLTDKKQQLEVHKLFLEYFKDFDNVEIVNQEEAHKERFIEKIANYFI